jgi:peptidyl-prolyl cis-trans isomerase C
MTTILGNRRAAPPPPLIQVNGTTIPRAAIAREVQHHPAPTPAASWQEAAKALVLRELLLQEARLKAISPRPQTDENGRRETKEEATIRTLVERNVRVPEPTEEELVRYYAANPGKFRSPAIVVARHILLAAPATDETAYAAARRKAEAIAAELAADPGRFGDLARACSDCVSSGEGGFLGQLLPDETTPQFQAALARLGEGETTVTPVATRYGFHIIRLEKRIPGPLLPFDRVSAHISQYLTERTRRTATVQYLAKLISAAEIVGIELAGAEAHRVN